MFKSLLPKLSSFIVSVMQLAVRLFSSLRDMERENWPFSLEIWLGSLRGKFGRLDWTTHGWTQATKGKPALQNAPKTFNLYLWSGIRFENVMIESASCWKTSLKFSSDVSRRLFSLQSIYIWEVIPLFGNNFRRTLATTTLVLKTLSREFPSIMVSTMQPVERLSSSLRDMERGIWRSFPEIWSSSLRGKFGIPERLRFGWTNINYLQALRNTPRYSNVTVRLFSLLLSREICQSSLRDLIKSLRTSLEGSIGSDVDGLTNKVRITETLKYMTIEWGRTDTRTQKARH